MSFERFVPSLQKLLLRYISKSCHAVFTLSDTKYEQINRLCPPHDSKTQKLKQEIIRACVRNGGFNDDTLPRQFFHTSSIKIEVNGAKISSIFITKLSSQCPNLQVVHLSGSFRLTDDSIDILVKNCTEIKDINIENCRKLTDLTLDALMEYSPKLHSFDIGGNFNMTIEKITYVIEKHPNHSKFLKVHIAGHVITDKMIEIITSKCRKLQSLSIGYAPIYDSTLIQLLEKRKSVSKLFIHWNRLTTDGLLQYISTSCPNIQELYLCGVKGISQTMVLDLIHRKMKSPPSTDDMESPFKKLKKIDLKYTTMDKDTITFIKDTYPDLQIIC